MRTTIDIPDPLFRRAKAAAARGGTTLRGIIVRAIEAHLGAPVPAADQPYRFNWKGIDLGGTPELLEEILAERRERHWVRDPKRRG
jgi:hypothetical protein